MSNAIRVPNPNCQAIIDFIRTQCPPGTEMVVNLVVPQGQEDVFVMQSIRTLDTAEAVVVMLDTVKAYIENNHVKLNEENEQ